jgi:hypothetical protein
MELLYDVSGGTSDEPMDESPYVISSPMGKVGIAAAACVPGDGQKNGRSKETPTSPSTC